MTSFTHKHPKKCNKIITGNRDTKSTDVVIIKSDKAEGVAVTLEVVHQFERWQWVKYRDTDLHKQYTPEQYQAIVHELVAAKYPGNWDHITESYIIQLLSRQKSIDPCCNRRGKRV